MADPAVLVRRLQALKSARSPHESTWKDCFDYTFPLRADGFQSTQLNAQSGQDKLARLVDGTATDSARILASGIMSGATPANSLWFQLGIANASDLEEKWLESTAQTLFERIHGSNYDSQGYESCLDIVCAGWFALYIEGEPSEGGFTFEQWPLSQVYAGSTKRGGAIDVVYREFDLSAEQALAEYGDGKDPKKGDGVSERTRKLAADKPDELVTFLQAIYPRAGGRVGALLAKDLPVTSCHVEIREKRIVRESGYHEMPVVVPRWHKLPRSVYAVGPTFDALPDIRMLNDLKRLEYGAADIAVAGMWIAVDDGVLNPRKVTIGARKIVTAADTDSMKALESGADFNVAFTAEERLQAAIRKVFMADQLQPQDGPQMTATEVHVRVGLIRQLLGPVYSRLQAEWLSGMIQRCFGIGARSGMFTQPPSTLNGRTYQVRYISPLARAQRQEEVTAMDQFELALGQQAALKPTVLDVYDADNAARERAHLLGVPAKLILSDDDVQKIRDDRAQAAAEQQQRDILAQGGSAAATAGGEALGRATVQ